MKMPTSVNNVLVFSDDQARWPDTEIIKIPEIKSTADYNKVIFFEVSKHLKTDYAIFIQYDGYVLSGMHFSEFFLKAPMWFPRCSLCFPCVVPAFPPSGCYGLLSASMRYPFHFLAASL